MNGNSEPVAEPGELGSGQAQITGIGKDPRRPLHDYWSETLRAAADTLAEGEQYTVETVALIKHESPGWVDGFRVSLH